MTKRKQDPLTAAQKIFTAAAPAAAALLADTLQSEDATVAQRISCAESILSRVLGKTGAAKEEPQPLRVSFSPEAADCAR